MATTLIHRMLGNGIRYGLQTMCEGGGQANATIFELLREWPGVAVHCAGVRVMEPASIPPGPHTAMNQADLAYRA